MKDTSRTLTFTFRSLLALAAFAAAALRADDNRPVPPASATPAFVDIDFPGGSLAQLFEMLPKTYRINIVGPKAYLAAPLPPFSVHLEHSGELLNLLALLLDSDGFRLAPISETTAVLSKHDAGSNGEFVSRDLSPFVDAQRSVDDIVDAIRTACAMTSSADPSALKIKYHPKSGLLLMAGPESELKVATRVIDGLLAHPKDEKLKSGANSDSMEK